MKKSLSRVVSFLTAFLILFAGSAFRAAADNSLTTEELVILPISDIPEVISYEDAIERGHVERLKSEETDMHSVIFRNSDGTKSLYMFASPVKYAASDGSVKDKSTDISITANGFGVTDNDVKLTFGNTSANATTVVNNGNTVMITPNGMNNADGILQNNTMIYNGVFGDNTMLVYTPLLSGLKAGIILKTQGEVTGFSFDLEAIGLTPSASVDGVINLNNTDNETVFEIGTYLVTDANGKYTEGEMILSGNAEDGYTVTANVDEAFLNAEDTAYPVVVEPSITLNTSSTIDDAIIYSEKPNKAYGAYKYNNIGYLDSYGVGRLLVKFPGLENNDTFNSLTAPQIRSAEYCMYTASSAGVSVDLFIYNIDNDWDETDVTWNSLGTIDIDKLLEVTSKYISGTTSIVNFDFTSITKMWSNDACDPNVIIKNGNEMSTYACRDFCSTEYADANNGNLMPYLTITYGEAQYAQVNIKIYVDAAFVQRSKEIYPNVSVKAAYTARILNLLSPAINDYKEEFAIQMTPIIEQTIYETCIDECTQKYNLDNHCSCSSTPESHHTNTDNVFDDVPNGDPDNYLSVFFTGHITCAENNNDCSIFTNLGKANAYYYKAAIYSSATSSLDYNTLNYYVISHELGHLFFVVDHYLEPCNDESGKSDFCIWGYHKSDVMTTRSMCNYCAKRLHDNYDLYDHT